MELTTSAENQVYELILNQQIKIISEFIQSQARINLEESVLIESSFHELYTNLQRVKKLVSSELFIISKLENDPVSSLSPLSEYHLPGVSRKEKRAAYSSS